MAKLGYNEPRLVTEFVGVKQGWAVVGKQRCYFRSGFEVEWAKYLELLKTLGEIYSWEYEPKEFEFEGIRSGTVFYIPDFRIVASEINPEFQPPRFLDEGEIYNTPAQIKQVIWYECKGHIKQKDVVKFK